MSAPAKNSLNMDLPSELKKHGVLSRSAGTAISAIARILFEDQSSRNLADVDIEGLVFAARLIGEQLQVAGEDLESLARDVPRMAEA